MQQLLKENGYQESNISKIFKRITNNHSFPQSQQQTQATDIQQEEIRIVSIYHTLNVLAKNCGVYPNLTK